MYRNIVDEKLLLLRNFEILNTKLKISGASYFSFVLFFFFCIIAMFRVTIKES